MLRIISIALILIFAALLFAVIIAVALLGGCRPTVPGTVGLHPPSKATAMMTAKSRAAKIKIKAIEIILSISPPLAPSRLRKGSGPSVWPRARKR